MQKGGKSRIEKQELWRNSIATTQILKRVNKHVLNELEIPMTSSQLKAADMLLKKTMPDLKSIEAIVDANLNVITPVLPDYLKDAD
jgi:hypothetical protein